MNKLVRMYEVDLSRVGGDIFYFHPGLNEKGEPLVWQGRTYQPFPIMIEGMEYDGQGRLPRPTLTVSNIEGQLGNLVRAYNDLNGCTVKHRMTLDNFLDAVNFIDGTNPTANPNLEFPSEIYIFERKAEETAEYIKFDLTSALDTEGQKLPKRNYNANYCSHKYRGPLCNYMGAACYDAADKAVAPEFDKCGRRLTSCELRFGKGNELPFGGFPGAGLIGR